MHPQQIPRQCVLTETPSSQQLREKAFRHRSVSSGSSHPRGRRSVSNGYSGGGDALGTTCSVIPPPHQEQRPSIPGPPRLGKPFTVERPPSASSISCLDSIVPAHCTVTAVECAWGTCGGRGYEEPAESLRKPQTTGSSSPTSWLTSHTI